MLFAPNSSVELAVMRNFARAVACPIDPAKKEDASTSFPALFRSPNPDPACTESSHCIATPACSQHVWDQNLRGFASTGEAQAYTLQNVDRVDAAIELDILKEAASDNTTGSSLPTLSPQSSGQPGAHGLISKPCDVSDFKVTNPLCCCQLPPLPRGLSKCLTHQLHALMRTLTISVLLHTWQAQMILRGGDCWARRAAAPTASESTTPPCPAPAGSSMPSTSCLTPATSLTGSLPISSSLWTGAGIVQACH